MRYAMPTAWKRRSIVKGSLVGSEGNLLNMAPSSGLLRAAKSGGNAKGEVVIDQNF